MLVLIVEEEVMEVGGWRLEEVGGLLTSCPHQPRRPPAGCCTGSARGCTPHLPGQRPRPQRMGPAIMKVFKY